MGLHATTASDELRAGLQARLPSIPSKYFYDDRGSELFEQITRVPEYYQTQTEEGILVADGDRIASASGAREVVELGSGAGRKVHIVLDALARRGTLERCVMFEINATFLADSVVSLQRSYPDVEVRGVEGDFERDLRALGPGGGRLVLFFAGTIGNLDPEGAARFLANMRRQLEPGDAFLIGFDLIKDPARLEAAYNDAAGVTAAFNRNILQVVNDRFGADFDPSAFTHVAFYDQDHDWIEMRLKARRSMEVHVREVDVRLELAPGDEIRTEISAKYDRPSVERLAAAGGMALGGWFPDPENLFALGLLHPVA